MPKGKGRTKAKVAVKACRITTNVSKIKVEENGRSAVIVNTPRVDHVVSAVDGCLVLNSVACDWVISKSEIGDIFIELKGSDVDHAVEQILETMRYWQAGGLRNGPFS